MRWIQKAASRVMATVVFVLMAQSVLAQDDLTGIWEGMLEIAPGQGVGVQFNFVRGTDGVLTATLSAPDQPGLQDLPVEDVSFEQGGLSLGVSALSGSYAGRLTDGVVEGTWSQPGSSIALTLRPYKEPVLTDSDKARLLGSWVGRLRPDPDSDLQVTVVFRFERDAQGGFVAFMDSPDEGAPSIPVDRMGMDNNTLTLAVNRARMEFIGTLDGDALNGDWVQATRSLELSLTRGEYEAPGLPLSDEQFARLEGPWHGQIGALTMVFRFERTPSGRVAAFIDTPDQGANNMPVTLAQMNGDDLIVSVAVIGGTFTGTIAENGIAGQWQQRGQQTGLNLTRGPFVPNPDLSIEDQRYLLGTWRGNVTGADLVFRFSSDGNGAFGAFLDVASVGLNNMPVSSMTLEGQSLRFQINAIDARFEGALSGGEITGSWTRLDETNPLRLLRD
ncbi:MAG: hypothetical protein Q8L60_14410 [Gammaproteobacteria bacterium]|nr:hypothetical protein [Gammaproteobacteria bacterium]MDP2139591.1 hypothetical protein [Gammaproteobacteria bacterium]MDP2346564.1 hypothetical protein [Gammaproteobacteria bacterium]